MSSFGQGDGYESPISLSDVMLKVMMSLYVMWLAASLNTARNESSSIERKAEFAVTAEWNKARDPVKDCDVDMWVRDPRGETVYFSYQEASGMNIERDDLGKRNDTFKLPDGQTVTVDEDKEYWYLRYIVPGEYTVNVHLYSCLNPISGLTETRIGRESGVDVDVVVYKLNPKMQIVASKKVRLQRVWDEETAVNFTLTADGRVASVTQIPVKLVVSKTDQPQVMPR